MLVDDRTHEVVATRVELATTRRARRVGLLGRDHFDPDAALVLAPCLAVHTAFMRFPIDIAFVDRHGRAVRLVHRLRPWRVALAPRAYAAIELPAGALTQHEVGVGDRLALVTLD
ncbi:MAG: DUF192 domain-containing protein [Acidobacteria bacterium]|nr:DUF192 domain-containing protein [Acidobacteriota bacterium]